MTLPSKCGVLAIGGELVQWEDAFSHTFHACLVRATRWQNKTLAPGLDLSFAV